MDKSAARRFVLPGITGTMEYKPAGGAAVIFWICFCHGPPALWSGRPRDLWPVRPFALRSGLGNRFPCAPGSRHGTSGDLPRGSRRKRNLDSIFAWRTLQRSRFRSGRICLCSQVVGRPCDPLRGAVCQPLSRALLDRRGSTKHVAHRQNLRCTGDKRET